MEINAEVSERIVREDECKSRTGLGRTSRWRLARDGKFPKPRRLSQNATGWLDSEITEWLRSREVA